MRTQILILISFLYLPLCSIAQTENNVLTVEDDMLTFKIKSDADSLFIYSSLFGYQKMKQERKFFYKNYSLDSSQYIIMFYVIYEYRNGKEEKLLADNFKGKYYPRPTPKKVEKLTGTFYKHKINSRFLKEERNLSIYTPPNFDKNKTYGIVYVLDGSKVKELALYVEHLILNKNIEDIVLIGIENKKPDETDSLVKKYGRFDYRGFDLLENQSATIFLKQLYSDITDKELIQQLLQRNSNFIKYVEFEVLPWVESWCKVSADYYKRSITGCSNGGAFVVTASKKVPHLFGSYLPFSFGANISNHQWSATPKPKFYMAVGKYEDGFLERVNKWTSVLKDEKIDYKLNVLPAGHDGVMWEMELLAYLKEIYGL